MRVKIVNMPQVVLKVSSRNRPALARLSVTCLEEIKEKYWILHDEKNTSLTEKLGSQLILVFKNESVNIDCYGVRADVGLF